MNKRIEEIKSEMLSIAFGNKTFAAMWEAAKHGDEPLAVRHLTKDAQLQREAWKDMPKCTNRYLAVCYCNACIHPGNPSKQINNPDCWEEDQPLPPRERMKDWVQS